MSRRSSPPPEGPRPSDRLEELARELTALAEQVTEAVRRLKEENDSDDDA